MSSLPGETYRLAYPNLPNLENPPYVSYGRRHHEACAHHVENTFQAQRVYLIASTSLSKNTSEVSKLQTALASRLAGTRIGISPHTPWDEVIAATKEAVAVKADCIVTLGGGSIIDGAKCMLLFIANDITSVEQIAPFGAKIRATQGAMRQSSAGLDCVAPTIPLICIPTTLSGGEYTQYAGGTDPETHYKLVMGHPFCGPRLIICDPLVTLTTPRWVWLSTGVRGVDHAVECYCRVHEPEESVDAAALEALRLIVAGLLGTAREWENEEARLRNLLGVGVALYMLRKGVLGTGASHGIGHQLGPLGVGHGETSCILLPSVSKWNAKVNGAKQERIKAVLWSEETVATVLKARGLKEDTADLGDCLDAVFRELGMPRTLQEVGVGRDKFAALAANSLKDFCCEVNPIPMVREEQVLEILEMCA